MDKVSSKNVVFLIYLVLALTTVTVFWQVHNYDFVKYDDTYYVTLNPQVKAGQDFPSKGKRTIPPKLNQIQRRPPNFRTNPSTNFRNEDRAIERFFIP